MGARFNSDYLATNYDIDPNHIEVQNIPTFADSQNPGTLRQFSRRENSETVLDFTGRLERSGQDTIDKMIDEYQDGIDKSKNFEDVTKRLLNRYQKQFKHRLKLAQIL